MKWRPHFRWIALFTFHLLIVLFTGILPLLKPVENSHAAFYNDPDKALNACILQWNLNTIRQKWNLDLADAPIFFPCKSGKFFSEHLLGHLIYAYPISLAGASSQTLYNLTYQINRLTIGIAASLLCLKVGAALVPALLAGGLLITSWNFGQIQNTGLCWALLAMFFFVRQMKNPGWVNALALALFFTLTALSNGYLAFYTPVALFLLLIVWMIYKKQWPGKLWATQMFVAVVLVSVALAPTMIGYWNVQKEYELVREGPNVARLILPFEKYELEHGAGGKYKEQIALTPAAGVVALLFVCAVLIILKGGFPHDGWGWGFSILAILSFWMAFYEFSPYSLIAKLPGFNGLRAAFRWYLFWMSGMTVVISLLFTMLMQTSRRWVQPALVGATLCLLIYSMVPGNEVREPVERLPQSSVYTFLGTLRPGPVCILPILPRGRLLYQIANADRMLYQLSYSFPMVSGYSGFVPKLTRMIEGTLMRDGVSETTIRKLAQTGVQYVVVDNLLPDTRGVANQLRSQRTGKILYDQNNEMVVELPHVARDPQQDLVALWRRTNTSRQP